MMRLLAAVLALSLAGCALMPAAPPNPVATAYRTITSTRILCAQYLERARITVDRARACLATTNDARTLLDAAVAADVAGNPKDAQEKFAALDRVLAELEKSLKEAQ